MACGPSTSWRPLLAFIALVFGASTVVAAFTLSLAAQQDRPTFREAVDVIEVDVRVIAKSGEPLAGLTADKFSVTIGGKARRVVSAEFVSYDTTVPTTSLRPVEPSTGMPVVLGSPRAESTPPPATGRIFLLYVDTSTFDVGSSRAIMTATASFVRRLQPNDQVGLFVFPVGSQIEPTTDHSLVINTLGKVVGSPTSAGSQEFGLRVSEVALLSSKNPGSGVGSQRAALVTLLCDGDQGCRRRLTDAVDAFIQEYETMAAQQLYNIRAVLQGLDSVVGRKTLVVLSGGVPTTAQPGSRPDIGQLDSRVGEAAQKSNTAIYTLYVDWRYTATASAEQRRAPRTFPPLSEDSELLRRSLAVFAGKAGGTFLQVNSGGGEVAFNRILRETSAYYVLAVAPDESDRDGRSRQLGVKVNAPGTSVLQTGRWVTVPKRP